MNTGDYSALTIAELKTRIHNLMDAMDQGYLSGLASELLLTRLTNELSSRSSD